MKINPRFSAKRSRRGLLAFIQGKSSHRPNTGMFLGPRTKALEWARTLGLGLGWLSLILGIYLGYQALFLDHSVQKAINSVLLILVGLILACVSSHDQFVSRRLKDANTRS